MTRATAALIVLAALLFYLGMALDAWLSPANPFARLPPNP